MTAGGSPAPSRSTPAPRPAAGSPLTLKRFHRRGQPRRGHRRHVGHFDFHLVLTQETGQDLTAATCSSGCGVGPQAAVPPGGKRRRSARAGCRGNFETASRLCVSRQWVAVSLNLRWLVADGDRDAMGVRVPSEEDRVTPGSLRHHRLGRVELPASMGGFAGYTEGEGSRTTHGRRLRRQ